MSKYLLVVIGLVLLCLLAALGTASSSPDTVTVNSTTDVSDGVTSSIAALIENPGADGLISLREAIVAANNTPGSDTIVFNIPTQDPGYEVSGISGTWTISISGSLPTLSADGTIISGTTQAAFIGYDPNPDGPEIEIAGEADSSTCLVITGAENVVHGLVVNQCLHGIEISGSSATTNTISGSYIGTDASGSSDLGNILYGVYIWNGAKNNLVGGDTEGERNVISGNDYAGVYIYYSGTDGNTVSGNYIGTDALGSSPLGNTLHGVMAWFGAQNNVIGGDTEGERNVISGNDYAGVYIYYSGTDGNTVSGNYIGTDALGSSPLGNSHFGVYVYNGPQNNVIGGDTEGERNVISGNGNYGVYIQSNDTGGNVVSGNYIGTDVTGTQDLGNGQDGVRIDNGAQDNTIGPDNLIAHNQSVGVSVRLSTTVRNTITQNGIHSNSDLGIDLAGGSNEGISAPTVSAANACFVMGTAGTGHTIEVFTGPDAEGKTYLTTVSADGDGNWTALGPFTLDTYVTATATDSAGNTSEFSAEVIPETCLQTFVPLTMKHY